MQVLSIKMDILSTPAFDFQIKTTYKISKNILLKQTKLDHQSWWEGETFFPRSQVYNLDWAAPWAPQLFVKRVKSHRKIDQGKENNRNGMVKNSGLKLQGKDGSCTGRGLLILILQSKYCFCFYFNWEMDLFSAKGHTAHFSQNYWMFYLIVVLIYEEL